MNENENVALLQESIESQFLSLSLSLCTREKKQKSKKGHELLSLSLAKKKLQRREKERERRRETFEREERREKRNFSLFRVFFSEKRMILFEKKKNRQTLQRQMTGSEKNLKDKKKKKS